MTVVFDSTALIPVSIKASRSARLFWRLLDAHHQIAISPALLEEVADKMRNKAVLRRWLNLTDDDIDQFLADLPKYCLVVPGYIQAPGSVPEDPEDEKIVATALESDASYIVSEDRHLLDLREHKGIKILTRDQMAGMLSTL